MSQHARTPNSLAGYLAAAEGLRPNERQWEAYESTGHCVVLAGPGSGKTKTLTIKLARMLHEDVAPPRGIACITYTRACAGELMHRLDAIGVHHTKRLFVGTVHSFCFQEVVVPFAKIAGTPIPDPVAVATDDDRRQLFDASVAAALGPDERPADWFRRFNQFRRTKLDRHRTAVPAEDARVSAIVAEYERRLHGAGLLDFERMVDLGLRLVEDHAWVRKALRAKFPILVVDEYQDMVPALDRLVRKLCFEQGMRLFAVGDPDQSIYGFNDASPELLVRLAERQGVQQVKLELNYRSGQRIIAAAEAALGQRRAYRSNLAEPGTITLHRRPDGLADQATFIATELVPAILSRLSDGDPSDIAILYRDHHTGSAMAKEVQAAGWNFIRMDRGNPLPQSPFTDWLRRCAAWCGDGWKSGEPRLSAIISDWLDLRRFAAPSIDRRELQVALVRFLLANRTPTMPAFEWLVAIQAACLEGFLATDHESRGERRNLDAMLRAFEPGGSFAAFTVSALGGQGGAAGHLNLMTLHNAKGLEFRAVIIPDLEQGRLPSYFSLRDKDAGDDRDFREERRLFYVGLTRSKAEVHLLSSGWYIGGRTRFANGPSVFLNEVAQSLRSGR